MRQLATGIAVLSGTGLLLATNSLSQTKAELPWRKFVHAPGAVDVAGPRADGRFVVTARDGLFLLRRSGSLIPFARGPNRYVPARGEPYIALASARRVPRAGCSFQKDDVYALDPVDHPGVTLIERTGRTRRFVDLPPGSFLSSIAFDSVGRFGYRLLVTALISGRTTLYAIDCRGRSRIVVRGAARVEGGSAVAPTTFGQFPGWLIAVDELSGSVYAFNAQGHVRLLARPAVQFGADLGVESVGFVPAGLTRRGAAYFADLGAPGSPTEGTDSVLRVSGSELTRARVRAGDLLVATEAKGVTVAIRCARRCTVRAVGRALDATHGEGHVAFAAR
jgi:hypothetical protein